MAAISEDAALTFCDGAPDTAPMNRGVSLGLSLWLGLVGCGRLEFGEGAEPGPPAGKLEILYPYPSAYYAVTEETALDIRPELLGVTKLTVEPALPAGLFFDEAKGKIVGTPSATVDRVKYVITGTGANPEDGSVTVEIFLTSLYGWSVDSLKNDPDDNNGVGSCFSTAGGGCTLRAAVETANTERIKKLILLPKGRYVVNQPLTPLLADLVIAGAGTEETFLAPDPPLPDNHSLLVSNASRAIRLENLTVEDFRPTTGSAIDISNGLFEAFEVQFRRNASKGGGVLGIAGGAKATFEHVTFRENRALVAPGQGGVINALGEDTEVTVRSSTANNNEALFGSFSYLGDGAILKIVNSSIVDNKAVNAGALSSAKGHHELTHSTVAFNKNDGTASAGIYANESDALYTLSNTLVAKNVNGAGAETNCDRRPTTTAKVISLGGNIVGDGGGSCAEFLSGPGDVLMTDPLFESDVPVAVSGGHTKTMPIKVRSPAVGRGVGLHCPTHDQRGLARKLDGGGACDSGAYELE